MLFIELPQIPNSWQSPQILLPFPSHVSVSPRELNVEIVLSLPAPLHLIPHLDYFNSIPSASLPLSHPLFFPNVPTMLPRRILPE